MGNLYDASAAALALFMVLGSVDGLYLHLWRYRLHTRPASLREHRLHTLSGLLFLATLPTIYLWETGGWLLWAGLGVIAFDQVVQFMDMFSERDSRAGLGGLSTGEYVLHMTITGVRGASLALALGARPAEAWSLSAPPILASLPAFASTVAWQSLPGTLAVVALHLWLCSARGVRAFEAGRARLAAAFRPPQCCAA